MLGGNQPTMNKQQVIIPKTTPVSNQSSMFVPITMANNVSVLTNPASSLMGAKRVIGQTGPSTTLRIQQQQVKRYFIFYTFLKLFFAIKMLR